MWFKKALARVANKFESIELGSKLKRGSTPRRRSSPCLATSVFYNEEKSAKRRRSSISFADEYGEALESAYYWEGSNGYEFDMTESDLEEEDDSSRAIILLINPKMKTFEFLHVSFEQEECKISIGDVLKQIGEMASDETLKKQTYVALLQIAENGQEELINSMSIQSYNLFDDELLISVVKNYDRSSMMRMAKAIMEKKRIMKALRMMDSKNFPIKKLKSLPKNDEELSTYADNDKEDKENDFVSIVG